MRVLLENCSEKREEWLKLKKAGIGSSQIAAVCRMSKHTTPLEVWAEMTEKVPAFEGNDHTWFGQEMEPVIGRLFSRKTGIQLIRPDILVADKDHDWALATPDFFTVPKEGEDKEIVEAKKVNYRQEKYWEDGEAPIAYQIQLNWQIGICLLKRGYVSGLVGGNPEEFYRLPYPFDAELHDTCMEEAEIFMELVKQDIPPGAGPGDAKLLGKLQGVRMDAMVMLSAEMAPTIDDFQVLGGRMTELNKEIKEIKTEQEILKGQILQALGNKTGGQLPDGRTISAKTIEHQERMNPGYSYVDFRIKKAETAKAKKKK